jgi:hypothetical protein
MVKVNINGMMEEFIMEIGKIIKCTERVGMNGIVIYLN